jgi:hypothetical protein
MNRETVKEIQTATERKCENCSAFESVKGECRKYAPRPSEKLGFHDSEWRIIWPSVRADDWCDDFTAKKRLR